MRRLFSLPLIAVALVLGTAACGGGDKTFDAEGVGITFKYPSDFAEISNITFAKRAGAEPTARAGIAIDRDNAITVSRYDLNATVTADSLDRYKSEIDGVVGQLAGKPVSGRRVEYGGLPGYEYAISLSKPKQGLSRIAVLFDQATEYFLNCQSTPGKRDTVEDACRKALDTLTTK